MISAVLFDLDDTLYPEADFYRAGFGAVAAELERRGVGNAPAIGIALEELHFRGPRSLVFNNAATQLGFPPAWVPEIVAVFRAWDPELHLYPDCPEILPGLRKRYRLGIVTDGHAAAQRKKIRALGVEALVDAIVVADELGREFWKPHPLPFHTCCRMLGVPPEQCVFVGDSPERDILGARGAGLYSIRLRRGDAYFAGVEPGPQAGPHAEIAGLHELPDLLGRIDLAW